MHHSQIKVLGQTDIKSEISVIVCIVLHVSKSIFDIILTDLLNISLGCFNTWVRVKWMLGL